MHNSCASLHDVSFVLPSAGQSAWNYPSFAAEIGWAEPSQAQATLEVSKV